MGRIYIETSVIGHLTGRMSRNIAVARRQAFIRQWWAQVRANQDLLISQIVVNECSEGDKTAARERLDAIQGLKILGITKPVVRLAEAFISAGAIPANEPRDALHVAIATSHPIEFLVTCDRKHIANDRTRLQVERICRQRGLPSPAICLPDDRKDIM